MAKWRLRGGIEMLPWGVGAEESVLSESSTLPPLFLAGLLPARVCYTVGETDCRVGFGLGGRCGGSVILRGVCAAEI